MKSTKHHLTAKLAGTAMAVMLAASPAIAVEFGDWNTNSDAGLDTSEFRAGFQSSGAFGQWDTDGDGSLSQSEFDAVRSSNQEAFTSRYGNDNPFAEWDANNDEALNEDEFYNSLYSGYDDDDDNVITQAEFDDVGTDMGAGGIWAQAQDQTQQTAQNDSSSATAAAGAVDEIQQSAGAAAPGANQAQAGAADNRLIATVNDAEIRQADVVSAIQGLPPQIQQMPPQMLLPVVVDQLLLRELILEEANAENLQADPEVTAALEPQNQALQDQAMVNVWLERELDERVTDEAVTQAFEKAKAVSPSPDVTLEQVRPQIEEALRQQAVREISAELRQDAQIVFYDPTGNPLPQASAGAGDASNTEATGSVNQAAPTQEGSSSADGTIAPSDTLDLHLTIRMARPHVGPSWRPRYCDSSKEDVIRVTALARCGIPFQQQFVGRFTAVCRLAVPRSPSRAGGADPEFHRPADTYSYGSHPQSTPSARLGPPLASDFHIWRSSSAAQGNGRAAGVVAKLS
jgi:hypothetical protein